MLASTMGRNVFLTKTYDVDTRLYPNLYVILVSPSGKCRKGGALSFAHRLLDAAGVHIHVEAITKRALTQALANEILVVDKVPQGESKLVIISDELEVFLGKDAGITGLFAMLTRLFDCPDRWEYITASQGKDYLHNVCLNVIGGTVPQWFKNLTTEVMGSGFLARIILVSQDSTPRKHSGVRKNGHTVEDVQGLKKWLIEFLVKLREIKKEVFLSSGAAEFYDGWYNDREAPTDERFLSFYEREHDHVLKVAMLLAASSGDLFSSNVVNVARVKEAIILMEKVKACMEGPYSEMGEGIASKMSERVIKLIREKGGEASHSWLLNRTWHLCKDTEDFKKVMQMLVEREKVKMSVTKRGKKVYKMSREKEEER